MNTYANTKGNKTFIAKGSWFVKANRLYGPNRSDIFFHGELFIDGKLVDNDYEISQRQLNRYFRQAVA
jgi:hypothetical protein